MNPNSIPLFRDTFMINGVPTMGPLKMPYRARCLEADESKPCQCRWFMSPPSSAANEFACSKCGHAIHSHVDYVSKIVHHCSASHCAAYVQESPRTQACTCAAMLISHRPMQNPYRLPEAQALMEHLEKQEIHTAARAQPKSSERPSGDVAKPHPSTNTNTLAPTPVTTPIDQSNTAQIKAVTQIEKDAIFIQKQMAEPGATKERSGQRSSVGMSRRHEENDLAAMRLLLGRL
ncbi:hypothetical protein EDD18DRAFT_1421008 [Armillaria luteobubalina]|uniref:Uncharacterized protein n=1 Tax=Armillaria luteobubalina TaxID=153913 RepID=A0AA39UY44_9AGAR|nr:hypothetical protein EDD18DRAFT_1421008 [Armillaria luteobubalina]